MKKIKVETPDRISVSIGRKVNIGNYESVDFHVSLSSDVSGEKEEVFEEMREWVEERINEQVNEVQAALSGGRKKKRKGGR